MERREFETLAVAELDAVCRFARFLTRDEALADDLVQDVYARAFRVESIERFELRGGGMRPWLLMIARTLFYGRLQREKVGKKAMEQVRNEAQTRSPTSEAPTAAEIGGVDWTRARPAIFEAMESLSDDLRETLWLWAVEGMKYREIGIATDVPIGTVMSRLHRARARVGRALLGDERAANELLSAGVVEPARIVQRKDQMTGEA